MTYPVTPDPSIHNNPNKRAESLAEVKALQQQMDLLFSQLPAQIVEGVVNAILTALGASPSVIAAADANIQSGYTSIQSLLGTTNTSALNALTQAQATVDNIINSITGGSSTGNQVTTMFSDLQNALAGLLPGVFSNTDGSATTLAGSLVTNNLDGTATAPVTANPLQQLIGNADGTVTTIATGLQNLLGSAGTHQALTNSIYAGSTGASTATGKTPTDVLNALTGLFGSTGAGSSALSNWTTLLAALGLGSVASMASGGAFVPATIPNITAGMSTDLQSVINNVVNFLTGTSGTQSSSSVLAALQSALGGLIPAALTNGDGTAAAVTGITVNADGSATYGPVLGTNPTLGTLSDNGDGTTTSLATVLQNLMGSVGTQQALTNSIVAGSTGAAAVSGKTQTDAHNALATTVSNLQASIDGVNQAIFGGAGTGNAPGTVKTSLVQVPAANIVPPPNASSGSVTEGAVGAGGTNAGPTVGTIVQTETHTPAATDNYVTVSACVYCNSGVAFSAAYGSQTMGLLGYESISNGPANLILAQFGLQITPGLGAQTVTVSAGSSFSTLQSLTFNSVSYTGYGGVGTVFTSFGTNGSPSMNISSATNNRVVQTFAVLAGSGSETISAYNQTSRYNSGSVGSPPVALVSGDAAGASTVTFSATSSQTSGNYWLGMGFSLMPAGSVTGSGMLRSRVSTSAVNLVSGSNVIPSSFFDTAGSISSDLSYSTTNNTVTIGVSGWYMATIDVLETSTLTAHVVGATLFKNNSAVAIGPYLNVNTTAANTYKWGGSFIVHCLAGDTLEPGYTSSANVTSAMVGEATGLASQWAVSLLNRSLL